MVITEVPASWSGTLFKSALLPLKRRAFEIYFAEAGWPTGGTVARQGCVQRSLCANGTLGKYSLSEATNLDVSEANLIAVVLKTEMSLLRHPVLGIFIEL